MEKHNTHMHVLNFKLGINRVALNAPAPKMAWSNLYTNQALQGQMEAKILPFLLNIFFCVWKYH
jgi:hypothetical protein